MPASPLAETRSLNVDTYLTAHPIPSRPSDKAIRAYLQTYIQTAAPGGLVFTQGAAQHLATLATTAAMRRQSIRERRGEVALAMRNLEALVAALGEDDRDELPEHAQRTLAANRIDAQTLRILEARQLFASVRPYGALAATLAPAVAAPVAANVNELAAERTAIEAPATPSDAVVASPSPVAEPEGEPTVDATSAASDATGSTESVASESVASAETATEPASAPAAAQTSATTSAVDEPAAEVMAGADDAATEASLGASEATASAAADPVSETGTAALDPNPVVARDTPVPNAPDEPAVAATTAAGDAATEVQADASTAPASADLTAASSEPVASAAADPEPEPTAEPAVVQPSSPESAADAPADSVTPAASATNDAVGTPDDAAAANPVRPARSA